MLKLHDVRWQMAVLVQIHLQGAAGVATGAG